MRDLHQQQQQQQQQRSLYLQYQAPPPQFLPQLALLHYRAQSQQSPHALVPQPQYQQPPQSFLLPHQQLIIMNGMNGAANMPAGAVVGLPTQMAQQAELNYIYGMVEELSRQLADNKRALEEVVAGVGRVRQRARANSLGNEELIDAAIEDINGNILRPTISS